MDDMSKKQRISDAQIEALIRGKITRAPSNATDPDDQVAWGGSKFLELLGRRNLPRYTDQKIPSSLWDLAREAEYKKLFLGSREYLDSLQPKVVYDFSDLEAISAVRGGKSRLLSQLATPSNPKVVILKHRRSGLSSLNFQVYNYPVLDEAHMDLRGNAIRYLEPRVWDLDILVSSIRFELGLNHKSVTETPVVGYLNRVGYMVDFKTGTVSNRSYQKELYNRLLRHK